MKEVTTELYEICRSDISSNKYVISVKKIENEKLGEHFILSERAYGGDTNEFMGRLNLNREEAMILLDLLEQQLRVGE